MQSTKQLSPLPTPSSVRVFQCRRLRAVPGLRDEEVKTARTYINWRCRCGMRHRYQPCQHDVRRIRGRQCTTSTPDSRRLSHTPKVGYFLIFCRLTVIAVISSVLSISNQNVRFVITEAYAYTSEQTSFLPEKPKTATSCACPHTSLQVRKM